MTPDPKPKRPPGRPPGRVKTEQYGGGRTTPDVIEKIRRCGGWAWVERLVRDAK